MGMQRVVGSVLLNLGIDPRKLKHVRNVGRYTRERRRFLAAGGKIDAVLPIIADYDDHAGTATGHYFHQDLLVARYIHEARPERHIDIGSRIDGFVAHVAAFRPIDVIDIRPLEAEPHRQITFLQCDLMEPQPQFIEATDSLSCLHALEHFGLGRYGDPIDPDGHKRAFPNMIRMVKHGGTFYLGVPVGRAAVVFNAHRVFAPAEPLEWAAGELELVQFDYVDDAGDLHLAAKLEQAADLAYGCGIYTFRRR